MTEAEWLACTDPKPMLDFLPTPVSERKLRLFSCACCRRVAHLLSDPEFAKTIEVGERYADKQITVEDCRNASRVLFDYYQRGCRENNVDLAVAWATMTHKGDSYPTCDAVYVVENSCRLGGFWVTGQDLDENQLRERAQQWALIRDIFGNPFRPIAFSPSWQTDTALSLAKQMYESRDFGVMPILADALQDAGCEDEQILNHCHDANQVHVRGCWVVDLVLGKE